MVAPAFKDSKALRDRIQRISVEIVDASVQPPSVAKDVLSRELLSLSSVLSMARAAGTLSPMNAISLCVKPILCSPTSLHTRIRKYRFRICRPLPRSRDPRRSRPFPAEKRQSIATYETSIQSSENHNGQIVKRHSVNGNGVKDKHGRKEAILSLLGSKALPI